MQHRRVPNSTSSSASALTVDGVVARLRRAMDNAEIDSDRVDADEDYRCRAAGLADAKRMRDAIVLVLGLLGDLDELTPEEPDRSAFRSTADLFQDIADFAAFASLAAHRAAGRGDVP